MLAIPLMLFLASAAAGAEGPFGPGMPKCKVCHSKDPRMVAMHRALEFKDCFTCHGPGGGLWPKEQRQEQKAKDPVCTRCHGPVNIIGPAPPG
jgi:predicted CXXCH cytochrome family protein